MKLSEEMKQDAEFLHNGGCCDRSVTRSLKQYIPEVEDLEEENKQLKEQIETYKECFELFIPTDKWDEATLFLSTYGSGLAKEIAKKES